ncbi:alpha/beta hydrolase family protein [Nocardioides dilutus]
MSARATDLGLAPTDAAPGEVSSASHVYDVGLGPETRHFTYRIPKSLAEAAPSTVPVVVLLHGGIPRGTGDEGFIRDFLDGIDETAAPYSGYAYVSLRAARLLPRQCRDRFQRRLLDRAGRDRCLARAAQGRQPWRFVGASASGSPDIDASDALTVEDPDAYADVATLRALLADLQATFPSLALDQVHLATFSYGSHVADQVICSASSLVRGVASITGSWLTARQFGADGTLGGNDGNTECGSGREPGHRALTGESSDAYGRRHRGFPSAQGTVRHRIPVFRALGRADHNLEEGLTAAVAARVMAALNGVRARPSSVALLPDIDPASDDGKAMTMAVHRTRRSGERLRAVRPLVIGQCGLSTRQGLPRFDPKVVPGKAGRGCDHGVWGKNDDASIGTDQHWPQLAIQFFEQL